MIFILKWKLLIYNSFVVFMQLLKVTLIFNIEQLSLTTKDQLDNHLRNKIIG